MYEESKYIVGEITDPETGRQELCAVVFPKNIHHSSFNRIFTGIWSAGFCTINDVEIKAYGESTSLRKKANPERDVLEIAKAICHPSYISKI